ncbi:MAG: LysR family transcriptional regulator [Archangium sp.]|nr:LysR family transcriptional regulator [Archangium sp.]
MSLDRLASFAAIVSSGGLARAAPGDPIVQSQFSRQLKELELAIGYPLLKRTPDGLTPTPAGRALFRAVRSLARELEEVVAIAAGERPKVVLGAGDSVLQWLVIPRLVELELGTLELELGAFSAEMTVTALQEERIDLGVLRANEASGDFKTVRLGTVEYGLFEAKRRMPLAVAMSEPGVARHALALGREVSLRCETFPQVAAAVRAGTHAGVLPVFAGRLLGDGVKRVEAPMLSGASSPLALAWKAKTLERRAELADLRRKLEHVLRRALAE